MECPQIPPQPPALAWQERQRLPYKQDPAPTAAATASITQGMIISMAAHCNMVNRRRMRCKQHTQLLNKKASPGWGWAGCKLVLQSLVAGRCEHCPGCRGLPRKRDAGGFAKQNCSQRAGPALDFPLGEQPGSFPGTLTTLSWTGLFCAPVTVQISVLPAPEVFPGWGCVSLAVEKSVPPRKCHYWCYLSNNGVKANN